MPFAPEVELRAGNFGLLGGAPTQVRALAPPALGLIAAACLAWIMCPAPPAHLLTWHELFVSSAVYVLRLLVSGAATAGAYAILGRRPGSRIRAIPWSTVTAAVWFAPLAVWLSENSVWAVAVGVILAAHVTRALIPEDGALPDACECSIPRERLPDSIFRSPLVEPMTGTLLLPLCCALLLQVACAASAVGQVTLAAVFAGIGTAAIVSRGGFADPTLSARPVWRGTAVIAIAVICTAAGLARYLNHGRPPDSNDSAGSSGVANSRQTPPSDVGRPTVSKVKGSTPASEAVTVATFPGIVLTPEEQPHTVLIPPLPAMQPGLFSASHATPLSIPFYGVYWIFKAPDTRPPENSLQARGSPAEHTFHSTDHRPLIMEAKQNFGMSIDLKCCREIQIAVNNADTYRWTVSIELILVDSTLPGKPSQSLGISPVKSSPYWTIYGDRPQAQPEVLSFAIPANMSIRSFDEVTVRYRLDAPRTDTAAKIAIERFVLVPR